MIITQCAVCATELGTGGKRCGRCSTRYCGPACQKQHWDAGGHDKLCKKIKKQGGAEQYNANKKCSEAVAIAVDKCADDTKGQTCYICTQALHWKTKEGLVRMCACRGTAGFAHVSCLAEQAKILFAEAEANNLDYKAKNERWGRWHTCSLCEQDYHGVVWCALGWACWKTYVGRPETDQARGFAMGRLGSGLSAADREAEALSVQEAELSMKRRLGASEYDLLAVQSNLSLTYSALGRNEEALSLRQEIYSRHLKLDGEESRETLVIAFNYAVSLVTLRRFEKAKLLLRKTTPVARRVLGESHELTLKMRWIYSKTLCANADEFLEAVTTLEETERIARRVLGRAHPLTSMIERQLQKTRDVLAARDGINVRAIGEAVAAMATSDA